jgi:hypothetical protein
MTQPSAADAEISGWYLQDNESQPQRVRVAIEGRSLSLCTQKGTEIARWSLDRLESVSIPVIDRDWVIRDRWVPDPVLLLQNDQDYGAIESQADDLAPVSARTAQQAKFAASEASNLTGWPVLLLLIAVPVVIWLWSNLPLAYCIATQQDTILFLKCLLIGHFIP